MVVSSFSCSGISTGDLNPIYNVPMLGTHKPITLNVRQRNDPMRLSILLYSTDPAASNPRHIEPVITSVDFAGSLQVSRTVGPANWFTIERRLIDHGEAATPAEDVSRVHYTEPAKIAALARGGSVLKVSYDFANSQRIAAICQALHTDVPTGAGGFFGSSAMFTFGPSDIVVFTEDADGQDDVKLLDVAQFEFTLSCDNYVGSRFDLFQQAIPSVEAFSTLRRDLENVVGPLKLHLSY
jgi:hypothetical protein